MKLKKIKVFSILAFTLITCFEPVYSADNEITSVNTISDKMVASVYIYEGTLNNPSLTYPVRTTFYKNNKGELMGEYIFNDKGKEIFGTLLNARMEEGYTVFKWKDIYGDGTLKIKFSSNLENFQGYWATYNDKPVDQNFTWLGQQSRIY